MYTLTPAGGNLFTPSVTAEMSLPSKGIAPITVPLVRAGPDHFLACHEPAFARTRARQRAPTSSRIPSPGSGVIVIRALRNEFDEVAVQANVDIR